MTRVYRFTCIVCPLGCYIEAEIEENKINVRGCRCPRGEKWVKEEILDPKRMIMSVVKVRNGEYPVVSVKSDGVVPKNRVRDVMRVLTKIEVMAPVKCGDVIVKNVLGLGVDIIATRDVGMSKE